VVPSIGHDTFTPVVLVSSRLKASIVMLRGCTHGESMFALTLLRRIVSSAALGRLAACEVCVLSVYQLFKLLQRLSLPAKKYFVTFGRNPPVSGEDIPKVNKPADPIVVKKGIVVL
jgi:hypothetical protein